MKRMFVTVALALAALLQSGCLFPVEEAPPFPFAGPWTTNARPRVTAANPSAVYRLVGQTLGPVTGSIDCSHVSLTASFVDVATGQRMTVPSHSAALSR